METNYSGKGASKSGTKSTPPLVYIHARDCECVCEINANTKIIIIVIERTEKGPTAESSLEIDGPLLQNLANSLHPRVSSSAWLTKGVGA